MKSFFALISTSLVVFIVGLASSQDSPPPTCSIPPVAEGEATAFTCHFHINMQNEGERRDISMKRKTKDGKIAEIIDCYWRAQDNGYYCKVINPRFYFNYDIRYNATVYLPDARPEDEGRYICDVTGYSSVDCDFTLREKTTCSPWSIVAVVFLVTAILLGAFLAAICLCGFFCPSKLIMLPCFRALKTNVVGDKDRSKSADAGEYARIHQDRTANHPGSTTYVNMEGDQNTGGTSSEYSSSRNSHPGVYNHLKPGSAVKGLCCKLQ